MSDTYRDTYSSIVNSPLGGLFASAVGLPRPATLRRYEPGAPLLTGPALIGGHGAAPLAEASRSVLSAAGVEVRSLDETDGSATDDAAVAEILRGERLAAVVVDLSEVRTPDDLETGRAILAPGLRALGPSGRVVVLGRPPYAEVGDPALVAARRAIEGMTRSIGKEMRAGGTANLVHVSPDLDADGAPEALESALRFLLSGRSAYVSGQVVTVGDRLPRTGAASPDPQPADWDEPLAGKCAVVTGAARGIGAAIAQVLGRDGAQVVCVDVPRAGAPLAEVAYDVGGTALQVDVTAEDAAERIIEHCEPVGGIDIVVHNAGITRDKLLVNTDAERWADVIDVNLDAILRMNRDLLGADGLHDGGRMVLVSSTSGIAGNRGQANYAASKAGIIGLVESLARDEGLAARGVTVNAVAPGFIETEMTAKIPLAVREFGRRINSLSQGGLPVDVAETVAWFAQPGSGAVSGNVLRVCGQSLLGA